MSFTGRAVNSMARIVMALFALVTLAQIVACSPGADQPRHTVSKLPNLAGPGGRYPFLSASPGHDSVLMSWLEGDSASVQLKWSEWGGGDWSSPELIVESDSFFDNWADFPSITAQGGAPRAAHWLQKVSGSTYAYHVNMALRDEAGKWSEPITPHRDPSPTEHGFVSLLPLDDSRVFALWLDGHQTANGRPMTLHSSVIDHDGTVVQEVEVDDSVCDCCQTSMARTGDSIVAVYRNRTPGETRDIYSAIFDIKAGEWNEPAAVHDDGWEIGGCPVNGPQVVAAGGLVLATWFTAANDDPRNYLAVSNNGGVDFSEPQQLNTGNSAGRVGVALNNQGTALVTWVEAGGERASVMARFWRNGEERGDMGPAFEIGPIDPSRASGFPRLAATGAGFLVAWTNPGAAPPVSTWLVTPNNE